VLAAAVSGLLVVGVGAAFAGLGGGNDPEVGEKTGIGRTYELADSQYEHAFKLNEASAPSDTPQSITTASGGGFSFFDDTLMPCDLAIEGPIGCGSASEPEVKSGPDGTIYVTGQEGTPAGIMAWRRDPGSFKYKQLQKPDGIPVVTPATSLTGGGGDNELAIGTPDPDLGGGYRVYTSSLNSLVTNGVEVSTDRGETWFSNPLASNFVGVDRQWLAASGPKTVYLSYHELAARSVLMVTSTDGGVSWGLPQEMFTLDTIKETSRFGLLGPGIGNGNWQSNMVALPDGSGVAFAYVRAAAGTPPNISTPDLDNPGSFSSVPYDDVWVAIGDGTTVRNIEVGRLVDRADGLFPAIAVDRDGNLYVTSSTRHGVFLWTSTDGGTTWSAPHDVTAAAPAANASTVFPYVVAGTAGRAALAWLGSSNPSTADDTAQWTVQFAYTDNALSAAPTFTVLQASNHVIHTGRICLNGTACTVENPVDDGRSLAEVLQMGITLDGRALISYPDDSTGAYLGAGAGVVEQNAGPGLFADVIPTPPPPPPPIGHPTATFTPGATTPLYFTQSGAGLGAGDGVITQAGYAFDGVNVGPGARLSSAPGTQGHAVVIGYVANSTPGLGVGDIFTGDPVATDTVLGGNLDFTLWVQNELAENGASELDFGLYDVAPDGSRLPITGITAQNGQDVVGGSEPTELNISYAVNPGGGGWFMPAGDHLELTVTFPFLVSSTTRLYYGDAAYDSGVAITTGTA
jgi:hypothetical protein